MPAPNARTNEKILALHDFSGGIHTEDNANHIPDNATPYSSNVLWLNGNLVRRPGLSSYTITGLSNANKDQRIAIHHAIYVDLRNGGTYAEVEILVTYDLVSTNHKIFFRTSATSGNFADSGLTISSSLRQAYSTVFNNYVYVVLGDGKIYTYTPSTGWSDIHTLQTDANLEPVGTANLVSRTPSRLLLATTNGADKPRIQWSDWSLPLVWNGPSQAAGTSGYQILRDSSYSRLTAITTVGTTIFAFTPTELYVGVPDQSAVYKFEKVYQNIGCSHQGTLQHIANSIYIWADIHGIYMGRLGEPPQRIDSPLHRFIADNTIFSSFSSLLNFNVYQLSYYDRLNNLYYLILGNFVLSLNLNNMSWHYHDLGDISATTVSQFSYKDPDFNYSDNYYLWYYDTPNTDMAAARFRFANDDDFGTDFQCTYNSKIHHFLGLSGGKFQQACIQKIRIVTDEEGTTSLALLQGNNWERLVETAMGDQDTGSSTDDVYLSGKTGESSEYFQFKISGNSSEFPRISGLQISFIDRGDTRQRS